MLGVERCIVMHPGWEIDSQMPWIYYVASDAEEHSAAS